METEEKVVGDTRQILIDVSIESWRFAKLFGRVLSKLDAGETQRHAGQLRYFLKKLDDSLDSAGLKLVNLEGHPYDPGMAASPLNIADFGPDDRSLREPDGRADRYGSRGLGEGRDANACESRITMKNYVGIDLGTTNSAVCSFDGENLKLYKSPDQNDVTPSAIFIDRRGNKYVGKRAYDAAARSPKMRRPCLNA